MGNKNKILIALNYQLYHIVYVSFGTVRRAGGGTTEKALLQEHGEPPEPYFVGDLELAKTPLGILANRCTPRPE